MIAILTGGNNGEREISLWSARHMASVLKNLHLDFTVFDVPSEIEKFLSSRDRFDVAIPLVHGTLWEDGQLTACLKTLGIPYLYSDFGTHAFCLDKLTTNLIVSSLGILTPKTALVSSLLELKTLEFNGKIFIKPTHGGSSVDNGMFDAIHDGQWLVEKILLTDSVLVQEYVLGKEYSVVVLGDASDGTLQVGWVIEIQSEATFFDYQAKYFSPQTREIYPAPLSEYDRDEVQSLALRIAQHFKIETMARVDFLRKPSGEWIFLEVNTIPWFTDASLVTKVLIANYGSCENWFREYFIKRWLLLLWNK